MYESTLNTLTVLSFHFEYFNENSDELEFVEKFT